MPAGSRLLISWDDGIEASRPQAIGISTIIRPGACTGTVVMPIYWRRSIDISIFRAYFIITVSVRQTIGFGAWLPCPSR